MAANYMHASYHYASLDSGGGAHEAPETKERHICPGANFARAARREKVTARHERSDLGCTVP